MDLAYPEIIDVDRDEEEYDPVLPVPQTINANKPENSKVQTTQSETARPPPTKKNYVIHQVKPNDTIEKLCLQYGVNKDVIRMANEFSGEEIYMFRELKIPYTYG